MEFRIIVDGLSLDIPLLNENYAIFLGIMNVAFKAHKDDIIEKLISYPNFPLTLGINSLHEDDPFNYKNPIEWTIIENRPDLFRLMLQKLSPQDILEVRLNYPPDASINNSRSLDIVSILSVLDNLEFLKVFYQEVELKRKITVSMENAWKMVFYYSKKVSQERLLLMLRFAKSDSTEIWSKVFDRPDVKAINLLINEISSADPNLLHFTLNSGLNTLLEVNAKRKNLIPKNGFRILLNSFLRKGAILTAEMSKREDVKEIIGKNENYNRAVSQTLGNIAKKNNQTLRNPFALTASFLSHPTSENPRVEELPLPSPPQTNKKSSSRQTKKSKGGGVYHKRYCVTKKKIKR